MRWETKENNSRQRERRLTKIFRAEIWAWSTCIFIFAKRTQLPSRMFLIQVIIKRMCGGEFENNLESTHKVNLYKAAKNKRDIKDV